MTEQLYSVAYISRRTMADQGVEDERDFADIVAAARENNPARGLTGALLSAGGCFAQVLEGPRGSVEQMFENIKRDARHSEIITLHLKTIEKREFPDWSMACVGLPDMTRGSLAIVADTRDVRSCAKGRAGADLITILQELTGPSLLCKEDHALEPDLVLAR